MELIPLHDRKHLLNFSRNVLENKINRRPVLEHFIPNSCEETYGGAFVSIYVNNELRGCVGRHTEMEILVDLVKYLSVAVLSDSRFKPIQLEELEDLTIEISIISEMEFINEPMELEIGLHGIFVKAGPKTGTFLPEVAVQQGWDEEMFVYNCMKDKAGIELNDPKLKLFVFTTDKFKEEKL